MNKLEQEGRAHYLSVQEWEEMLKRTGFEIINYSVGECYAKQGMVIIAKKVKSET